MTTAALSLSDAFRWLFLVMAGLYFGVALAVLRRYFGEPPRSALRRLHVVFVSLGTSLLVAGTTGQVLERLGDPLAWYGAPVGFAGVALITVALASLYASQSGPRAGGRRADDAGPSVTVRQELRAAGHHDAARRVPGIALALIVAMPLLAGLWMLAERQDSDQDAARSGAIELVDGLEAELVQALRERRRDLVAGCVRNLEDRIGEQAQEKALAAFFTTAALARARSGDDDVAAAYRRSAREAGARARAAEARAFGLSANATPADRERVCGAAYPDRARDVETRVDALRRRLRLRLG